MSNQYFIQKLTNEISSIISERDRANQHDRMATRGDMLEETTADLFSRYFPDRSGFGKGCVQDFDGNQSNEIDVVVFDRDSIPPICHGSKQDRAKRVEGFFPIDSLWYVVEVKKTLNNTEIRKTVKTMETIKSLKSLNRNPARMLFAYNSDLKKIGIQEEFERYKRMDNNWNKDPSIHVMCIVGKGYIFSQFGKRKSDGKKVLLWKYIDAQENYFEVACCISGMINTITGQYFGPYLFDESTIQILDEIELIDL